MTRDLLLDEPEQHDAAGRLHRLELDRRRFLALFGGGLLVCLAEPLDAQESGRPGRGAGDLPQELTAWLHIGKDGRVRVFTGKVEVGQNIRTSLAQQVAEELRVPLSSVELVMGDTALTPFDMGTFGSRTTPTIGPHLRKVAATAREALLRMAAERWQASADKLRAEDGKVVDTASGRTIAYGELTGGQDLKLVVSDARVTPPSDWKVAGSAAPKGNGRDFVTGKHRYTSDLSRAGLLHGAVLRPPSFKASLASLDDSKARALPGVVVVRDGDFAAAAAPDATVARAAREALVATWKELPEQPGSADLFEHLKKTSRPARDEDAAARAAVAEALAGAEVKLSQTYRVAFIAHAPLEPRAALAEWKDGALTVWTGSQRPFGVRDELREAFGLPAEKVRVIVPDTGSAYGGKHQGDAAVEAARLAKAAGKPVKVVWTREEEFTWAYFRPAGVIEVKSGARRDGTLSAWEFHNINSGPAGLDTPYDVARKVVQFHQADSPLRQGSYRGLAATANHFARESHMDELAAALKRDPLALRLANLKEPRLKAVLQAASEKFGWGKKPGAGRGYGLACGVEKGGYVATCVEVEVGADRRPRVVRVVEAFECGAIVNPDGLRNQVEGAIVQGLGGALFEEVRFEKGRIANPHFSQYRVPRTIDVPPIELVLLDRKDLPPSGAGETPIIGIAPAIGNAIFAAIGVRLTSLPMLPSGKLPDLV